MTISRFDEWQIGISLILLISAVWQSIRAYRAERKRWEAKDDIVKDGWITNYTENPWAYEDKHEQVMKVRRRAILNNVFLTPLLIFAPVIVLAIAKIDL